MVLVACGSSGGSSSSAPQSSDSSATPAADSAHGKPCVAVSDPLPAGAPAVPVKVGPPPTELVQQGLPGMKVGGTRLLGLPAELAYGSTPPPGSGIAPDEPLWFVVELRDVQG